jgi:hypothetical protein
MLNFKRIKALPQNTVSGMNKGMLFANSSGTSAGATCYCLTPTGGEQQVSVQIPANNNTIFPVYTSKWTSNTATILGYEVN